MDNFVSWKAPLYRRGVGVMLLTKRCQCFIKMFFVNLYITIQST